MSSLLKSTLNTSTLPTGDLRYIRSDFPEKLSDEEVQCPVFLRGRKR